MPKPRAAKVKVAEARVVPGSVREFSCRGEGATTSESVPGHRHVRIEMSPGSPLQPSLRTLVTIRITTAPKRALHPVVLWSSMSSPSCCRGNKNAKFTRPAMKSNALETCLLLTQSGHSNLIFHGRIVLTLLGVEGHGARFAQRSPCPGREAHCGRQRSCRTSAPNSRGTCAARRECWQVKSAARAVRTNACGAC